MQGFVSTFCPGTVDGCEPRSRVGTDADADHDHLPEYMLSVSTTSSTMTCRAFDALRLESGQQGHFARYSLSAILHYFPVTYLQTWCRLDTHHA